MNIPANIRVNVSFPFPALVTANGPVTLGGGGSVQNGGTAGAGGAGGAGYIVLIEYF